MEVFTGEEKLDTEEMSLLCNRGYASIVSEVWLLKWIVLFKKIHYSIDIIFTIKNPRTNYIRLSTYGSVAVCF